MQLSQTILSLGIFWGERLQLGSPSVPEPAAWLLVLGAGAVFAYRRFRRTAPSV